MEFRRVLFRSPAPTYASALRFRSAEEAWKAGRAALSRTERRLRPDLQAAEPAAMARIARRAVRPRGIEVLPRRAPEVGLDGSLQLDRERGAGPVHGLADGQTDPPLADAVLLHVGLLDALEAHAHPPLECGGVVVRALRGLACAAFPGRAAGGPAPSVPARAPDHGRGLWTGERGRARGPRRSWPFGEKR